MGNCFSDPSSSSKKGQGKGQVLGSGPASSTSPANTANTNSGSAAGRKQTNYQASTPAALGGSTGQQGSERERALQAAEERAKAVSRVCECEQRAIAILWSGS